MSNTVRLGRKLMALLQPMTGARSTGTLTLRSRADIPEVELPANRHFVPVLRSAVGGESLAANLVFRTAEPALITPAGVTIAATSNVGGKVHNLPIGTVFRSADDDPRIESIVGASAFTGATTFTGCNSVKAVSFYEQLGSSTQARDLFLAKVADVPAVVLCWESTGTATKVGPNINRRKETWAFHCIAKRVDAGELRAAEGMGIADNVERLIMRRAFVDGERIVSTDIGIEGRGRLFVAATAYGYTVRFSADVAVQAIDERVFEEWQKISITEITTPPDETLDPSVVTMVDRATYDLDPSTPLPDENP